MKRREFITHTSYATAALISTPGLSFPDQGRFTTDVEVLNPQHRVPLSFIIDDSTSLVNMAHFGIPQFAEVFPDRYLQDWKSLPREIPDAFVLEFIGWCSEHGVKGKYSMVPYPACTGWLHRFLPGWSKQELRDSIKIVREIVSKDWDIHPEMISHTRVIDIKTGLPYARATPEYMENWEWSQDKSADELASYLAYALNVLKETGLYCEGVTTPGNFGSRNMDNLAKATLDAVRQVYSVDTPHFFRAVITDPAKSVAPQVFHPSGLDSNDPSCSVHIIGCTDDWFGGWDGLTPGEVDQFITADLSQGRLVEVIDSGEPAIMVCHWPGIYYNGEKLGFNIFKEVVRRIHEKYDNIIWMKNSEIARYWAAKELTRITGGPDKIVFKAPFAVKDFTIKAGHLLPDPVLEFQGQTIPLKQVSTVKELKSGTWSKQGEATVYCFDLPKGQCIISTI